MKISGVIILSVFTGFLSINAQNITNKCGEDYVKQQVSAATGSYENTRNSFFETIDPILKQTDQPEGVIYKIPVIVHIIYQTAEDNITREQVLDAISVLNRDYRRLNADTSITRAIFKPVAADTEIEFVLAKLDPQGNCTEGITRTFSNLSANASDNVKSLIHWDNKKYVNIWVVKNIAIGGGTVLGYAYKPAGPTQSYIQDGIVIRHDHFGAIGTALHPTLGSQAIGRTLVHEMGHYLGLDHTFEGGCSVNGGDHCADTPPVFQNNFGCQIGINSCTNDNPDLPDQVENYMDYSDDDCYNMFTNNQKGIMRASLASFNLRGSLVSSTNILFTGTTPNQVLPCVPKPFFKADNTLVCEGSTVQFTDKTYMGNPTSYLWTFAGGNPVTSTDQNPVITYATKGNYDVTLVTTNASGTTDTVQKGHISVRSQTNTPYVNAFGDDFELYPIPNENWHVVPGLDTMNFRYFSKVAFAGSSCVTVQNFNAYKDEVDAMISHTINLSNSKSLSLTFRYAFAERIMNNSDALRIYVSDDCGATWNLESARLGPLLRTTTARINDTAWYPTLATNWAMATLSLDKYAYNPTPIMLKFEFENGGGNNFYLDEVLLTTTIGTEELFADASPLVYPNPAHDFVTINLPIAGGNIVISDVTGRIVASKTLSATEKTATMPLTNLAPGLYLVTILQGENVTTTKIIVQ